MKRQSLMGLKGAAFNATKANVSGQRITATFQHALYNNPNPASVALTCCKVGCWEALPRFTTRGDQ